MARLVVSVVAAVIALGACRTALNFVGVPTAQPGTNFGLDTQFKGHLRASSSHPNGAPSSSTASIVAPLVGVAMLVGARALQAASGVRRNGSQKIVVARRAEGETDVKEGTDIFSQLAQAATQKEDMTKGNPMFNEDVWLPNAWTPGEKSQTRADWYRKVDRIGPELATFDVTIPKPMGIRIQAFPDQKKKPGVGIVAIAEGGNTDKLNYSVCVQDFRDSMWVLEGDRVMAVNGEECYKEDVNQITQRVVESPGDSITLTLMRNTRRGPIRVVMLPEGKMATVKRGSKLSVAAEYSLGRELKFGCIDGWCGTCWHRERSTNGVFKPCCDTITDEWDNTMPLAMYPKPERAGDSEGVIQPRGV